MNDKKRSFDPSIGKWYNSADGSAQAANARSHEAKREKKALK